ncbi:MAG: glutamate synthase large subunit [Actinomycetota bacterium]
MSEAVSNHPVGLYRPQYERDACGIGFVADVEGRSSRATVETALYSLCRVRHRGALAADLKSGDGAGILVPIPKDFFKTETGAGSIEADTLGIAMCFVWPPSEQRHRKIVEQACRQEGIDAPIWRTVPTQDSALGARALESKPLIEQAVLVKPIGAGPEESEQLAVRARKRAEKACQAEAVNAYFPSFSFRTVTYKALSVADHLSMFYPDLDDAGFAAPFAMFHQRFSTNTSPTWERAQPFRMSCHNGEINTIQGNVNRMRAREGRLGKRNLSDEDLLRPVIDEQGSDSGMLDNVLELLNVEGRDVRHSMAMMLPAAWENQDGLDEELRDFYRYHACLMEAWDGPAGVIFTDGVKIGAALDRNGLRPLRYSVCEDGMIACGSEAGSIYTRGHGKVRRGKLGPGQMICVDPQDGGFEEDPVAKRLAGHKPYGQWLADHLEPGPNIIEPSLEIPSDIVSRQIANGFTREEFTTIIRPMASNGHEPTSSMGDDTALAPLAERTRPLYNYFKQRFAQVTNPPIDSLRERSVMSIRTLVGPRDPILWERPEAAGLVELDSFVLFGPLGDIRIDATFPVAEGLAGLENSLNRICEEAAQAARTGSHIIVVTDGNISAERAPIPMLLAVSAIHQHLIRCGDRTRSGLVVETDEAREAHHFACLLGYGAEAIFPRLALASISDLVGRNRLGEDISVTEALIRFRAAIEEGVLKIMSKMGISPTESYRGAQIFDAIGIGAAVIDKYFTGTPSPMEGIGLEEIAEDVLIRHAAAYGEKPRLDNPGFLKFHSKGEYHATNPQVVDALHEAVKTTDWESYHRFAALVEERPPTEPRDLLEFKMAASPVPLDEVEPVEAITARFSTGAISHGAIGAEAHETLAIALNSVGGKANSGEGGEDPSRYLDERRCKIKQVASGRFGVTPQYASFAEELQIKMAQGSKPGEGGQLPGHKVSDEIARLRHTQPGVALISPPPHHDIYSIEDLAQLIFDLKQVNPTAAVSVKLVAEAGVGTIAAGVAKALADVVQISGWDGGTGASPLSSIKNAGLPWELGIAETQQTLMANGLRERVRVRVDGGLKSGRDVMMAALLGADEYSFGTSLLLAEGCIMVRACHRDTCPVGIATQRKDLRAKFAGTPEQVAQYLLFVAEECRRILASLGVRSLDEAIGATNLLIPRKLESPRANMLALGPMLAAEEGIRHFVKADPIQKPRSDLGDRICSDALGPILAGETIELSYDVQNSDRTLGARLGGAIAHEFGANPPPGRATVSFDGEAGQSFGAFLSSGVTFRLTGEANDYVGKAMGGGRIVIIPPADDAGEPYLIGNTVLYGATGGELFCAGRAGERFAIRNSGAVAVVEGVGDHGCEYMTGGTVVVLGPTGWNMGAGMTGGEAYVWDPERYLPARVNPELVDLHRPDEAFQEFLRALITTHAAETGSVRAKTILENWETHGPQFWRVAPKAEVARIESAHEGSVRTEKA